MNEYLWGVFLNHQAKDMAISMKQWESKPICNITEAVKRDLDQATIKGLNEYGVTMDRKDLSLLDWLRHAYSETLDKAKYLKKAIKMMEDEVERANG